MSTEEPTVAQDHGTHVSPSCDVTVYSMRQPCLPSVLQVHLSHLAEGVEDLALGMVAAGNCYTVGYVQEESVGHEQLVAASGEDRNIG
jgi:hypothetical protein